LRVAKINSAFNAVVCQWISVKLCLLFCVLIFEDF